MGTDGGRIGRSSSKGGVGYGAGGIAKQVKGVLNVGPRSLTKGPQGTIRRSKARRARKIVGRQLGPRVGRAGRGHVSWNKARFGNPSSISTGKFTATNDRAGRNAMRKLMSRQARADAKANGISYGKTVRTVGNKLVLTIAAR